MEAADLAKEDMDALREDGFDPVDLVRQSLAEIRAKAVKVSAFACPRCGGQSSGENTLCTSCTMEGLRKFGWIK